MAQAVADRTVARFGVFEVNFVSGELRKRGIKIPIQAQPLEILRMLVEQSGEVVTRRELRERLWPADTFVDFEHSLNSSVRMLRRALGDSSDNPRFVETLARRGYRFIAPVQGVDESEPAARSEAAAAAAAQVSPQPLARRAQGRLAVVVAGAVLLAALAFYWLLPAPAPRVARVTQITHSVAVDAWGDLVTDGARLYFLERERDHWNLVQTSTSGGPVQRIPAPFRNTRILDVSPDLSEFLIASFVQRGEEMLIWIMPAQGGTPRRLGDVVAGVARWMPGGRQILYGKGQNLFVVNADGSSSHKFAGLSGSAGSLSWSPDGRVFRCTVNEPRTGAGLWEIPAGGGVPRRIFADPGNRQGDWNGFFSPDGKYFLFSSERGGQSALWGVREGAGFPRRVNRQPVRLTSGPGAFWGGVPSRDGRRVFLFGVRPGSDELSRYEIATRRLAPYMPGMRAESATFSRDGKWIAYAVGPESTIWRSRADGSERRQLTFPGIHAHRPTWSPDASRIAFQGEIPGGTPRISIVPSEGGAPRPLAGEDTQAFPDWSPDGGSIAYWSSRAGDSAGTIALHDIGTGRTSKLPGSEGKMAPRWSPDGGRIAALSEDQKKVLTYDVRARAWSERAAGILLTGPNWSADGSFLYFQDLLEADQPVYRIGPAGRAPERVADFRESLVGGVFRSGFVGLTPEGDLLVVLSRNHPDIYALDLE